jgi:CRP/FNR family transcriptional regulator, cyclic AMP receptor protein
MTAREGLQRAPLFKDFSESGLETLAEIARPRTIHAGDPIFVEGTVGDALFVVVAGSVRVSQRAGAEEVELATLGPGDHLGDLGLLARTVRLVSAVAATECEVLELSRREFFKMAQEKPVTCLKLAAVIAGELARHAGQSRDVLRGVAPRKA